MDIKGRTLIHSGGREGQEGFLEQAHFEDHIGDNPIKEFSGNHEKCVSDREIECTKVEDIWKRI